MSFMRVHDDGENVLFNTPSESRPEHSHEIHLERRTGCLYCSCEAGTLKGMQGHILHPDDGCRHIKALHSFLARTPREGGA